MLLMNLMDIQEMDESVPPGPVLPRLDRLDLLLQLLEEKHSLSARHSSHAVAQKVIKQGDDQCKTLSSALEEVQHKGTLMERLTMLENRVLQLSLEMDEGNTSKSSSSTVPPCAVKLDRAFASSTGKDEMNDTNEVVMNLPGNQNPVSVINLESDTACNAGKISCKKGRRQNQKGHKKWLKWFHLGCT